jgi:hypothetical protein
VGIDRALGRAAGELPFLNRAFGTTPLRIADWGVCVGLASFVPWAGELRKPGGRQLRAAT